MGILFHYYIQRVGCLSADFFCEKSSVREDQYFGVFRQIKRVIAVNVRYRIGRCTLS